MVYIVYIKAGTKWSIGAKFVYKIHAINYRNDLIKRGVFYNNELKIITKEKEYM